MAHTSGWTCPGCQRRVPARIDECYCGVKRSQAPPVQSVDRGSRGVLWMGAALIGAVALLAAISLRRDAPPPAPSAMPQPRGTWAPMLAPPASPPLVRRQAPLSAAAPATPPASPHEGSPTPAPPVATPEPAASSVESLDDHRQRAAEAFDRTLEQLAVKAEHFRKEVRYYHSGCQSGAGPWPPAGCDSARQELRQSIEELRKVLEDSDEEARRASVYPGVRAEIRRLHGLDEEAWGTLLRSAKEALE